MIDAEGLSPHVSYVCQWQRHPKDKHPATSAQWSWINAPDDAESYGPYEYMIRAWILLRGGGLRNVMRYYTA